MTPAIVLAAGLSSRYTGGNKLLVRFRGRPLIVHVIAHLQPKARPIVVVTGHQAGRLRLGLYRHLGHASHLHFVHNPDYRDGMAGSLQLGLRALPAGATKAFICLGDMPGIDARLLRRLEQAWRTDLAMVRPTCRGRPGHPVLVHKRLFPALQTLRGDSGARSVLASVPAARRKRVPWHAGCIIDTDTPAALRRAELQTRRINASVSP